MEKQRFNPCLSLCQPRFHLSCSAIMCHVNTMDQLPNLEYKPAIQRSDCGFERRKTFAVEMNALARSSDIQRSFLSVSCEHYGSIPTLAAQTCDPAEAVTGLKRGAAEQVRTSYPCITTQQRGRDAEAKKRPVRLRDLAARRGLVPKGAFLSWCRWPDSNRHAIAGGGF